MRDLFREIFSSLRQNKLRTALTGFAVAWGIFMLIALLGAGNGVLNALTSNSAGSLDHSMSVYSGFTDKPYAGYERGRRILLDRRDLEALKDEPFSAYVDDICPTLTQYDSLVYGDRFLYVVMNGVTPVYKDIQNVEMVHGRFLNELDSRDRRKSVVIGTAEAEILLGTGRNPAALVGQFVRIGPFSWQVAGLYKTDESTGGNTPSVYGPFETIRDIYAKGNEIPAILFSFHGIETEEESERFETAYRQTVNAAHSAAPDDEGTLYIWNRLMTTQQMGKVIKTIRTALWILGLFTLLSGIVGVSNIMLITVKERTHEFGIRKAIGARPGSLLWLIISESVLITAFFGYVGMVLGLVANRIMDLTLGDKPIEAGLFKVTMFVDPTVGLDVAVKATVLLIVAGTVAGLVPAWKAAKVKPIEALRADR